MGQNSRQHWSAQRYAETAHFVPTLGAPVLELLMPAAGEHILDLGCGDGVLTERIAAAGATVVGVDAAPDMVAAAQARGLDARVVAGQHLAFDDEFDAVFSNAALHWMRPPEAVLAGVYRALKPGGRFVGEMGGHNNTAAIMVAIRAVLARRGLDAASSEPVVVPVGRSLSRKARSRRVHRRRHPHRAAPDPAAGRARSLARHLHRGFFRRLAAARSDAGALRSRRSAAPDPDGRERRLDRGLRPSAFSRP